MQYVPGKKFTGPNHDEMAYDCRNLDHPLPRLVVSGADNSFVFCN